MKQVKREGPPVAVGDPGYLLLFNFGGSAHGTLIARIPAPGNYFDGREPFRTVSGALIIHPTSLLRPRLPVRGTDIGPFVPGASAAWEGPYLCLERPDGFGWPMHPSFGSVVLGYCDEDGNGPFSTNPYLNDHLLGVPQPPTP